MKVAIIILAIFFSCCAMANGKAIKEIPGKVIQREQLVEMFDNINDNGQWNMSGDMLWGYFFTDHDPEKLEAAKILLANKGYRFVKIFISPKDDPEKPDLFGLHVEKIETHSPQSLDKRNDELYLFAHEQGLLSYDGMDVGPVPE